ncbi:MAG: FadR family transcriptional regulator [Deltaproteobacteria bacterium]|nr:FadR family transcriptional regulator [Deltaproteobacteria bacterium]
MPFVIKKTLDHPSRLSDRVKNLLKDAIWEGEIQPGERLPSEEEIARELKVSKVTVREALREMESEGLIEKRRGMYGGSFVTKPNLEKLRDHMANYYHSGGITPEELVEFRRILEPILISLAVERRTKEDLAAIRRNIQNYERLIEEGTLDHGVAVEFHRLIADSCHNPLVSAVMAALTGVFVEILSHIPMGMEEARIDLASCKEFYDCLLHRRKDKAHRLMVEHFDTLASIIDDARARNVKFGKGADPGSGAPPTGVGGTNSRTAETNEASSFAKRTIDKPGYSPHR